MNGGSGNVLGQWMHLVAWCTFFLRVLFLFVFLSVWVASLLLRQWPLPQNRALTPFLAALGPFCGSGMCDHVTCCLECGNHERLPTTHPHIFGIKFKETRHTKRWARGQAPYSVQDIQVLAGCKSFPSINKWLGSSMAEEPDDQWRISKDQNLLEYYGVIIVSRGPYSPKCTTKEPLRKP